jgi:cytochrome c-type biogenesis protein CcmE
MEPNRQRTLWYVVGGVLIVGFLAFGASSFTKNLTPYVDFEAARSAAAKVQVKGALVEASTSYIEDTQELSFRIIDEVNDVLPVRYDGIKPGNFEEATEIVAVGTWQDDAFHADQLLVKCPSKYQGVEEDVTSHGESV